MEKSQQHLSSSHALKGIFSYTDKEEREDEFFNIDIIPIYNLRRDVFQNHISSYATTIIKQMQKERELKVKGGKKEYVEIPQYDPNEEDIDINEGIGERINLLSPFPPAVNTNCKKRRKTR